MSRETSGLGSDTPAPAKGVAQLSAGQPCSASAAAACRAEHLTWVCAAGSESIPTQQLQHYCPPSHNQEGPHHYALGPVMHLLEGPMCCAALAELLIAALQRLSTIIQTFVV